MGPFRSRCNPPQDVVTRVNGCNDLVDARLVATRGVQSTDRYGLEGLTAVRTPVLACHPVRGTRDA